LLLALYSWWVLRKPRSRLDALDAAYAALCRKLARGGSARAANEGPAAYSMRLGAPGGPVEPARKLIDDYARLRYACMSPAESAVREFARAVRRLRRGRLFAKLNENGALASR
jgi:hypothetical protein